MRIKKRKNNFDISKRRRSAAPVILVGAAVIVLAAAGIALATGLLDGVGDYQPTDNVKISRAEGSAGTLTLPPVPSATFRPVDIPDWIEQRFIRVSPYSRPGTLMEAVNGVVIHNTGNPGTTGEQNRLYFDRRADQEDPETAISVSSNFVIGLDGEILMLMPMYEMAYASNHRNIDTISIECCHPDETGEFTEATYRSLVKLVRWLSEEFDLDREQILRHFDVYEDKDCPRDFWKHPEKWEQFKEDVFAA